MRKDIVKAEKNQNFDTASKNSGVTTQYILTTFIFHFNHDHSRSNTQSMNDVMIDWHKNPIKIWMSFSTFKLGNLQFWQLIKKSNTTFSFTYLRQSNNSDRYLQTDSVKFFVRNCLQSLASKNLLVYELASKLIDLPHHETQFHQVQRKNCFFKN